MLSDLGDHSVRVTDVTTWLEANNGGVLKGQFWELSNDLCEGILSERWESLTDSEKFERLIEIIVLWPCYSTASFLHQLYTIGTDAEAEALLWRRIVFLLEHVDRLHREAIEYVLWVDFFEDSDSAVKAWNGLMSANPSDKAKRRLLVNSGPVPYTEKRSYYQELYSNPNDHELLAECLARSLQDVYGDIDRDQAKAMMASLQVSSENRFMSYLQENL
ncbi:MAG: hypothetical protein ACRBBQ_10505 [Cognatishimia sp.]